MSRDFPASVDPWRLVDSGRGFNGTWPLDRLSRLMPLLAPPVEGEVSFTLQFGRDQTGVPVVDVTLGASVPLQCQRTLARYMQRVEQTSRLGLLRDEADDASLPEAYEPLVVADGAVTLTDIVEDELILALPLIPAATDNTVEAGFGPASPEMENPFAVLSELGLSKRQ
ncbi:MAG: YceD family protein [Lysobacterales bacterium]